CVLRPYLPSSFLMTLASCGANTSSWLSLRLSLPLLTSRLWRIPACCFMTLPLPVTLKRFLAPECVFCLGILLFLRCVGLRRRVGLVLRRRGLRRAAPGRVRCLPCLDLRLGRGLRLVRADDHDHVAAVDRGG